MASDNQIQMPGVFGGLMRYNEEYTSKFMLKPAYVIGFIIAIAVVVLAVRILFPITA